MHSVDPSPKGSLEELFRHHLLESEAAAVPPAPHVWEQVDNSLLLQQNEQYRRRLRSTRWAMAASLLLAVLAGGGWWQSQLMRTRARLAAATSDATPAAGLLAATSREPTLLARPSLGLVTSSTNPFAIGQTSTFSAPATFSSFALPVGYAAYGIFSGPALAHGTARHGSAGRTSLAASSAGYLTTATGTYASLPYSPEPAAYFGAEASADASAADAADQLGARLASLRLPGQVAPPAELATKPLSELNAPRSSRPWQLQLAYAGGVFDPNIDFTKSPGSYNANLGPGTVATTREAAAEYRSNLRSGLSQRLSLWATRRLGIGRWALRTGLEVSQNEASSASSVAFVGEQVATNNAYVQVLPNRLQTTNYRYRSVSVPVEAVYTRPLRGGLSLYGRAGALVTTLLHVRSEVDNDPEAERSYSIRSAGSPYRHLSASVRAGLGVHYQPASQDWTFNLGPVAETGIMSLNMDPSQTFWKQQRPYSVGLEAGLEFGAPLKLQP